VVYVGYFARQSNISCIYGRTRKNGHYYKGGNIMVRIQKNWEIVKDEYIRHLWACADEDCYQQYGRNVVYVEPFIYQNIGTPVCDWCSNDMEYIQTEICTGEDNG
jgi:hypothetical protein